MAERASQRAIANGTGFLRELLVMPGADEARLFKAIADEVGLGYLGTVDPAWPVAREEQCLTLLKEPAGPRIVRLDRRDGTIIHAIGDPDLDMVRLKAIVEGDPERARFIVIATPNALRRAILERVKPTLAEDARNRLFLERTSMSAALVVTGWQGCLVGGLAIALPVSLVLAFAPTLMVLNIVAAITFCACIALRFFALTAAQPLRRRDVPLPDPAELPVYSVLVALYKEREVVPELLVSLGKLQWPRSKLEIKLVCEEDDHETLAALRAHRLHPCIEIVEVPTGAPRTKPKALAYALPLCGGAFVTLFDAEDRPHPLQLVEAWRRFASEGSDLACLQAPLVTTNGGAGMLPRMFAFEYAGLFRALLPWLAGRAMPLPLGGTSNHFRRTALEEAGGWDPYNVTEDADLGMRFSRLGYRVGVIDLPTLEDGPESLSAWRPQRTRWFKGWMQTWLVHMRDPVQLYRELGPVAFLMVQVLVLGMLASALLHPVFFVTLLYIAGKAALFGAIGGFEAIMIAIGSISIVCGYGAFIAIGAMTLSAREKLRLPSIVLSTPPYWILLSWAAWMALVEIVRRPHHWNKTPHKPTRAYLRQMRTSPPPRITRGRSPARL